MTEFQIPLESLTSIRDKTVLITGTYYTHSPLPAANHPKQNLLKLIKPSQAAPPASAKQPYLYVSLSALE
jgi:hypothetical protein